VRHLVRRGGDAFLLFWIVVTLTFVLVRAAPGDAADLLVPPNASAAEAARVRSDLGLDAPIAVQYARWIGAVLRGDLGESFALHQPVALVLRDALPVSIWLGGASLVLTFVIGVAIGMVQAMRPDSLRDRVLTTVTVSIYAAPSYWLSLALVSVFTYGATRWGFPAALRLPAFGVLDPAGDSFGVGSLPDLLRHAVLPVLALAAIGAAGIARYARAQLLDLAAEEWVRTARAIGLSRSAVMRRHVLPNALPTLVVLLGLSLPGIVAGSVFVESVFAWPGMGRAMLSAISARDYPVVMGATLLYAAAVILANLVADLTLPFLDPRRRT
jgi:peptide/nickel transport system permease protein